MILEILWQEILLSTSRSHLYGYFSSIVPYLLAKTVFIPRNFRSFKTTFFNIILGLPHSFFNTISHHASHLWIGASAGQWRTWPYHDYHLNQPPCLILSSIRSICTFRQIWSILILSNLDDSHIHLSSLHHSTCRYIGLQLPNSYWLTAI